MDDIVSFAVRQAREDDTNFLLATWLKSYRIIAHDDAINPVVSRIPGQTYFKGQELAIKRILKSAQVLIAHDREDPAFIYGYMVFEPGKIHYAYVKGSFRRLGVATELLKESGLDTAHALEFSHHTPDIYWIKQKLPTLTYNPYLEPAGVIA